MIPPPHHLTTSPPRQSPILPHPRGEKSSMLSDSPAAAGPVPPPGGNGPGRPKYRIRFRKGGDLRLVSHHDLMHCVERMLRRAGLPFHTTQGFNPKPRMAFALSLGLGIVGCQEVLELELDAPLPADE